MNAQLFPKMRLAFFLTSAPMLILLGCTNSMSSIGQSSESSSQGASSSCPLPNNNAKLALENLEKLIVSGHLDKVDDMLVYRNSTGTQSDVDQKVDGISNGYFMPWPGGVVPIAFSAEVTIDQQNQIWSACSIWASAGNIKCVAKTNELRFVTMTSGNSGCYSTVGMAPNTNPNYMNLGGGCWSARIVIHEIGHVLGLIHEHQRVDRDQFVQVHYENVIPGAEPNFDIWTGSRTHGTYDFLSIMHYRPSNFSRNGADTITVRPGYEAYQNVMGSLSQTTISQGDRETIANIYGPPVGAKLLSVTLTSPVGGTTFTAGQTVTLAASTQSDGMSITRVEFFDNGAKLGEDLSAPYQWPTQALTEGTHIFAAKVYGTDGSSITSTPVTISVIATNGEPDPEVTPPENCP